MAIATKSDYLEFRDVATNSNKFWRIELYGTYFEVTFGRIGTNGQTQVKRFGDTYAASDAYTKLVRSKRAKGYVDVGGKAAPTAPTAPTAKPITKAKPKPKAPAKPEMTTQELIDSFAETLKQLK